jgi:hypothetical protein
MFLGTLMAHKNFLKCLDIYIFISILKHINNVLNMFK